MPLPKVDVPVFETTLISNGKKVKFRPFLVKEQKLLLMALESKESDDVINTVKQILHNCIITEIDVDDLPIFDIEHLFLQLRARSVGENVELKYKCNAILEDEKRCNGIVEIDVNILDIVPTKSPDHSEKIELTKTMGLVMKYPSFNNLDISSKNQVDQTIDMIINCINFIYDEDQIYYAKDSTKEELVEFIENLTQDDLEKIQHFFKTMPYLKKDLDFNCPKCGYKEKIVVEGIENFFM
jgi:hypothetical protein